MRVGGSMPVRSKVPSLNGRIFWSSWRGALLVAMFVGTWQTSYAADSATKLLYVPITRSNLNAFQYFDAEAKKFVDISLPANAPDVARNCTLSPAVDASAANAVAPVAAALIAWLSEKIVKSLVNAAAAEVKEYSQEISISSTFLSTTPSHQWHPIGVDSGAGKSVDVGQSACAVFVEKQGDGVADLSNARLLVFVQYLQTSPVLRVRPLATYVKGSRIPKVDGKASVSFAATLELEGISVDAAGQPASNSSRRGFGSGLLLKAKASGQGVRKGVWIVERPIGWAESLVLVALPGAIDNTSAPSGYLQAKLTFAETSPPPKFLKNVADFLGSKSDKLSEALAAALEDL